MSVFQLLQHDVDSNRFEAQVAFAFELRIDRHQIVFTGDLQPVSGLIEQRAIRLTVGIGVPTSRVEAIGARTRFSSRASKHRAESTDDKRTDAASRRRGGARPTWGFPLLIARS